MSLSDLNGSGGDGSSESKRVRKRKGAISDAEMASLKRSNNGGEVILSTENRALRSAVAKQRKAGAGEVGENKGTDEKKAKMPDREEDDVGEVVQVDGSSDEEKDALANELHDSASYPTESDGEVGVKKARDRRASRPKKREEGKSKEVPVTNRRVTRLSAGKQQRKSIYVYEEDSVSDETPIMKSSVGKKVKESGSVKKKGRGSGFSRKRGREALDAETTADKPRDGSNQKRSTQKKMRNRSRKTHASGKTRQAKHSDEVEPKQLKDRDAHPVGGSVTPKKSAGTFLRDSFGRFRKSSPRRDDEESIKADNNPSSGNQSEPQRSSSLRGRKKLNKAGSMVSKRKLQFTSEKTTSAQKTASRESKKGRKPSNMDSSSSKNQAVFKGQSSSSSATRIAKQEVRDQIKDILLKAGWELDFRPRNGRDYLDAVYISPNGNTYWSITKAYSAFERQMNRSGSNTVSNSSRKSSKTSKGNSQMLKKAPVFTLVPEEALSILKKVIVKRRSDWQMKKTHKKRSKKELEESKRNIEDRRNKKIKGAASFKHKISKHVKANGKEFKKTKRNHIAGSTAKAIALVKKRSGKSIVGSRLKSSAQKRGVRKQRGNKLLVRGQGADIYVPYAFRRTIMSWMIDLEVMPASGKVKYMKPNCTKAMLRGWITRNGIHCSCCSKILTVSMFEVHAGSKLRQPYQNVYLDGAGVSLLQCQLNALDKHAGSVRRSFFSVDTGGDDPNDDTCGICGDGGDLICCDGCPSTFHQSCLGIQMLPSGDWHCINCICRFCSLVSSPDSQENGITDSQLLSCAQCQKKYHQKCIPQEDVILVSSSLPCVSFCGNGCKEIFEQLQHLVGVKNGLDAGLSFTLLQHVDEDLPESVIQLDQRVQCNSKMAVAHAVMDECFLPIIDQRSGINLITNVVYHCGSNISRLNYHGFYTIILERHDEIISVATLRILGTKYAEMPFIGTRNIYRRQGMCRRLLNGIESVLCSLGIGKLIIPAISDLVDTWTNVFGFKTAEVSLKEELRSVNVLVFPGTGLLFKAVQKNDSFEHPFGVDNAVSAQCDNKAQRAVPDSSVVSSESCDSVHGSEPAVVEDKSLGAATDEVMTQCGDDAERNVPDFVVVSTESCESPPASEPRFLVDMSSEAAIDEVIAKCEDEPEGIVLDSTVASPEVVDPETKLSESTAHIENKANVGTAGAADDILAKPTVESDCRSSDDSNFTSPDSGACNAVDVILLPDLNEAIYTSTDTIASTTAESGGNDPQHLPEGPEEPSSGACHCNGSAGFTVDNCDVKHEVGTLDLNFSEDLELFNSQICSGRFGTAPDNSLSTTEHQAHVVGDNTVHVVQESEDKATDLDHRSCFDDGDAGPSTSEVTRTLLYAGAAKKCQESYVSSASFDGLLKL